MFFIYFIPLTLTIKPIYIVAGFGGSPIYSTIKEPDLYPDCPPDLDQTLILSSTSSNITFLDENTLCASKLFRVHLNKTSGKVEQLPGIYTNSSPIGNTSEIPEYYSALISELTKIGYTDNINLFSVGYNYFLHPVTSFSVYDKLKEKIEEVYSSTQEKAIIISFGQGTSFSSIFLSNYSTPEWSRQYIDKIIFLAPAFAGSPSFSQLITQSIDLLPDSEEMKKTISMMPGLHIMLPNYHVFRDKTIIYNLYSDFDQHNASYTFKFLKMQGKVDDESESIFKSCAELYLKDPIPEPPVPSLIIYNDGIMQNVSYVINRHQSNSVTSIYKNLGDGTITSEGAEYACKNWNSVTCKNLHNLIDHDQFISSATVIQHIIDYIQMQDDEKPHKNHALFLASGFEGSPLYATITDPSKAPMCPSNLNNYLFYTTFIDNMYQFIDNENSLFWLTDDCITYLTRSELSANQADISFSSGVILQSSKFGDYNHLFGFDRLIEKATNDGYVHYKDLFGVGFNYIHYPFLNDQTYEELKASIEKYYIKTGLKSILTGYDFGANFMNNFITKYVSLEWAEKYISAVIYYSPYFAGSGTYDRLVTGHFGADLPTKSTSTMPSLHIMMPNEAVYGNKTVIYNYPKEGDSSNSTYASNLLIQLGKFDADSEKIFKKTDEYRKEAPKEPPVPTLIIYNDYINTGNGYIYNKTSNSVNSFDGKGDGTISSEGAEYACKNWSNSICFNHHNREIDHKSITSNWATVNLTSYFIEQITKSKDFPINKTYVITGVNDKFADSSYVNSHKIDKSKFTYSSNTNSLNNYPLSNAFDSTNSYWIPDKDNTDDFKNSITIEFNNLVYLEAILFDPSYLTRNEYREFPGFPKRLNIYTSFDGEEFQFNSVFIGSPVFPWKQVQFRFPTPIYCTKIKLEFDEVIFESHFTKKYRPVINNLHFISADNNNNFNAISKLKLPYSNPLYLNDRILSNDNITCGTNGGSKRRYPTRNLFKGEGNYWISDKPNTDDFINNIIFTFDDVVEFDSIFFDAFYSDVDKEYKGFPLKMNIYTSSKNSIFNFITQFIGNPNYNNKRLHLKFQNKINCDKIKLEFVEITKQNVYGTPNFNPVIGNIVFFNDYEKIPLKGVINEYSSEDYVNSLLIPSSSFKATTNGGEESGKPFTNCFDNNKGTFWVSSKANSEDFLNSITIEFEKTMNITSIIYDPSYLSNSRIFEGFPKTINVYTSIGNDDEYKLLCIFNGNPVNSMTRILLQFKETINCNKIKLEFLNLIPIINDGTYRLAIGGLSIIRENKCPYLTFQNAVGNYVNNTYINLHTILFDEFTYTNNGEARQGKPLTNAFDNNSATYFFSKIENSDTFHNMITLTFKNPVKIEAFLYDTSYHTSGQTRNFDGFPQKLHIYKKLGNNQIELAYIFKGKPVWPMTRIQFVFEEPIFCDTLKLEYYDITPNYGDNAKIIVTGGLLFLHHYTNNYSVLTYKGSSDNYVNAAYKTSHKINTGEFTYTANGGSKTGNDLSYAFDSIGNTYWYSNTINSNTFRNTVTISFKITTSIQAFLYDTSYHTSGQSRTFDGFPTNLHVLYQKGNNSFELAAVFKGNPVWPMTQIQFVLEKPIFCDKLKLVFYELTPVYNNQPIVPVIGNLYFIRERLTFQGVSGNYNNNDYISTHQIKTSQFTAYTNGGEKSNYPFTNLFDNVATTFYVSDIENNETFKNTITIMFKSRHNLDAILLDTAYSTISSNLRNFHGFPAELTIYKAVGNDDYQVAEVFEGFPLHPLTKTQFKFSSPVFCDRIKLEFTQVTIQTMSNTKSGYNPTAGNLFFLQYETLTPIPIQTPEQTPGPTIDPDELPTTTYESVSVDDSSSIVESSETQQSGESSDSSFESESESLSESESDSIEDSSSEQVSDSSSEQESESSEIVESDSSSSSEESSSDEVSDSSFESDSETISDSSSEQESDSSSLESSSEPESDSSTDSETISDSSSEQEMDSSSSLESSSLESSSELESDSSSESSNEQESSSSSPPQLSESPTPLDSSSDQETETATETPSFTTIITKPPPDPTILPTSSPKASSSPTASQTPTILPTPVDFLCEDINRCTVEGNDTHPLTLTISSSNFTNSTSRTDGGAIRIVNAGIICSGVTFTNCSTQKGSGGGGIFVHNSADINSDITLEHIEFTECQADFGSAVYVYCNTFVSRVTIQYCNFTMNKASSQDDNNQLHYGGSAIFISARTGIINECFFSNNIGEGGSLKIHNHFAENKMKRTKKSLRINEADFIISNCKFEIEKNSMCSLYYFRGDKGSLYEMSNCVFNGDLPLNARYIEGKAISIESPKLRVLKCTFDNTYERSINRANNYLSIDPSDQVFSKAVEKNDNNRKLSKNTWALIGAVIAVVCVVVLLIIVLVIFIVVSKKKIREKELELENSSRFQDMSSD